MKDNHAPIAKSVKPKPNGSHLEPVAKAVAPHQQTGGRTVGTEGKFASGPEGVPSGIKEDRKNLSPRSRGTKDSPPSKWVTPKLDRPQPKTRMTPRHKAKRVI